MTRIKICGITRAQDAELAVDLGAWGLGFILWPHSPRVADPAVAAGIARAMRRRAQLVGVFVDQPLDEVAALADALGLTHLQLHGDEGPAYCTEARRRTGCRVIKAARVATAADLRNLERYATDLHLLDAAVPGRQGGSGQAWDWRLVAQRRSSVPMILSGGLTPETVGDGIAAVHPWAVDVASGVESAPGVKDPDKLAAFMAAVRATDPVAVPAPEATV